MPLPQLLAVLASYCEACSGLRSDGVNLSPCPGCLATHYCSPRCRERDRRKHQLMCGSTAVDGFVARLAALACRPDPFDGSIPTDDEGEDWALRSWLRDTAVYVGEHRVLPYGTTLEEVDGLMAQGRVAAPHMHRWVHYLYVWALQLWGMCANILGRQGEKQEQQAREAFVGAVEEQLAYLLESDDDPIWTDEDNHLVLLLRVTEEYGKAMHILGRHQEAVEVGRRLKPRVEAIIQADGPLSSMRESNRLALTSFYMQYGFWLAQYRASICFAEGHEETAQRAAATEGLLAEAELLMRRALEAGGQGVVLDSTMVVIYARLCDILLARHSYDEALKLALEGMQLDRHLHNGLFQIALECLMELRRDRQAESLITEALARYRRDPGVLSEPTRAMALHNHGIILSRRGDYERARTRLEAAHKIYRARGGDKPTTVEHSMLLALLMEVLDRLGKTGAMEKLESDHFRAATWRPSYVVRYAGWMMEADEEASAKSMLRRYAEGYGSGRYEWEMRDRWREGEAVRPLEMLRGLLEEGSDERRGVEALIVKAAGEDEELRRQVLEDLQRQMGQERDERRRGRKSSKGGAGGRGKGSKASRKKRKKRERKKQQQQRRGGGEGGGGEEGEEGAEATGGAADLARLSLEDDEGEEGGDRMQAQEVDEEEEEAECAMCLGGFGDEEEDGAQGVEEVLGCGHRYHDVCIDRWLCKCREKGLLPTCPMCRARLVRGALG